MQREKYVNNTHIYLMCEYHDRNPIELKKCLRVKEGKIVIPRCRCSSSIRASLRESSRDPEARRLSQRLKSEAVLEFQHRLQALRYGADGGREVPEARSALL